uniref:SAM-dependent methyltransferase n=1 Tax=Steinernema glaseri TaxID=37863 RepID=A0A1I8AV89_9BILA
LEAAEAADLDWEAERPEGGTMRTEEWRITVGIRGSNHR